MRTVAALAGILAGVLGTHLDLGRRFDAVASRVEALSVRIDHVEKAMGERKGEVK